MPDQSHKNSSEGTVTWQSPSNIALIKYWGKYDGQMPANPSLSMTLKNAHTITSLKYRPTRHPGTLIQDFSVHNEPGQKFKDRIEKYFRLLSENIPEMTEYEFSIHTKNTFPHSAGIASSASAFSALSLCILSWHENIIKDSFNREEFYNKASNFARLGSGSASRSVFGKYALWGKFKAVRGSSNEYAIPLNQEISNDFIHLKDTILIVNSGEKKVSSSMGHQTMNGHPFAQSRYQQAGENLRIILEAMKEGSWNTFQEIVENEAMTLHSLMMSAKTGFILMDENTLRIIEELKKFREQRQIKICFTLDAGPNVHILFPASEEPKIRPFIQEALLKYCEKEHFLEDETGEGPVLIKNEMR